MSKRIIDIKAAMCVRNFLCLHRRRRRRPHHLQFLIFFSLQNANRPR